MRTGLDHRGLSLIEVLIAGAILAVGLLALMSAFPTGYIDVVASGGQSKAAAYAQAQMEMLKNTPFNLGLPPGGPPPDGNDIPEAGYTRTWTITQVAGAPPNRLWRITVTVNWQGSRPQTITLETMRAE